MRVARQLRHLGFAVAVGVAFAPTLAFAEEPNSAQGETSAMREAKERYARGLKLFADKDYEAARIEFMKAYELAPSNTILYNIGVSDAYRNDYVSAIRTLEKYLKEGGNDVPADRRTDVENLLKDIRPRIGHLSITANVPGAVVAVDDKVVGTAPLRESVDVNPGTRKVSVTKEGYFPATQAITVAGSENLDVALTLEPTVTLKVGASPWPFVLWGTTAALAIGAGVTGGLAIKASNDLANFGSACSTCAPPTGTSAQPTVAASDLESKRSEMRTLSIVADALTGGAIVAGVVALIVTVTTGGKKTTRETPHAVGVHFGPGGALLSGVF